MSGTTQVVANDWGLGSRPICLPALSSAPLLVHASRGTPPTHLVLYGVWVLNPAVAATYVQLFDVAKAGWATGVAALATPGAQTGIVVTTIGGATLANSDVLLLDEGVKSEAVTITALSGTGPYTVAFTTTLAHATSGPVPLAAGVVVGTTVPTLILDAPGSGRNNLDLPAVGVRFVRGLAVAAATTALGAGAPGTAAILNLLIA